MYAYHEYRDLSKKKPWRCGVCGLDICHPVHQPNLPGVVIVPPPRPHMQFDYWAAPEPTEPDQYGHPPGHAMYGVDDRQAVLTF
jgi:hypothetical protein